jgi:hypothetical protein
MPQASPTRDIIVIGGSSGAYEPLRDLLRTLPVMPSAGE